MRKKLRSKGGFTLTELLTALAVLGLLTLTMTVGMSSSLRIYRQSTMLSESQVLYSTLVQSITDELRFARNIEGTDAPTFTSAAYGQNASLGIDGDGLVTVGSHPLVGSGAYTNFTAQVENKFDPDSGCFTVTLTLHQGSERFPSESTPFSVRALNAPPPAPSELPTAPA